MSTTTTRLGLYKTASDGSENVNVVTDLLNNWDSIDLNFGFRSVTSSTRPSSPFTGQIIRESDTSRTLLWNGSSWIDIVNTQGASTSTVTVTTSGATAGAFSVTADGTASAGVVTIVTSSTAKRAFDYRVTGDAVSRVRLDASSTSGTITLGDGTTADVNLYRSAANTLATDDDLAINAAGKGLKVKEGSNAKMGVTSAMTAGSITVSTTAVTASSRIFLTAQTTGGTPGALRVSARTAGTSFTITSTSGTDTSTVAWMIVEPA